MVYRFSDLLLDLEQRKLSRNGEDIRLPNLSFEVLSVLVREAPKLVPYDEIIEQAWGANRIVTPENLAQRVMMLRRSLGDDAGSPRYIEVVHGRGLQLIPAVRSADSAAPGSSFRNKAPLAVGVLVIAVLFGSLFYYVNNPVLEEVNNPVAQPERVVRRVNLSQGPSVAVLPFTNLSPDPEKAFLAAGIHEEVLNQLAKLRGFGVISRTSMMPYAESGLSIPEIADQLKVKNLIEGSVRYSENRIRVTIQLLDGASDTHLWSETYDREFEDIFEIESDIARNVASVLSHTLSDDESSRLDRAPTRNLEAYGEYVLGRQSLARRTPRSLRQALAHFEQANRLDPQYLKAWIGQADAWALMVDYANIDRHATFVPREEAIAQAMRINPGASEVLLARAKLSEDQGDNPAAESHYVRSLELDSGNAQAWHWYSHFLALHQVRIVEGMEALNNALALNPLAAELQSLHAALLARLGMPERGMQVLHEAVELNPDLPILYAMMSWRHTSAGNLAEALFWTRKGLRLTSTYPDLYEMECRGLRNLGDEAAAGACDRDLRERFPEKETGLELDLDQALLKAPLHPELWEDFLLAYVLGGERELALKLAQRLVPDYFGVDEIDIHPLMAPTAALTGMLLSQEGDTERGGYLMNAALLAMDPEQGAGRYDFQIWDVVTLASLGKESLTVDRLRSAVEWGWRSGWQHLRGGPFAAMMDQPEWVALVEEVEADIAHQRVLYRQHQHEEVWPQ